MLRHTPIQGTDMRAGEMSYRTQGARDRYRYSSCERERQRDPVPCFLN